MAVFNQVFVSEAVKNNRFSAEFFDSRYVFTPAKDSVWVPIGKVLKQCEYGLSIAMNTSGTGFPIFRMNEIEGCFALRPLKYANIPHPLFKAYSLKENDVLFNRTNSYDFVGRTGLIKEQTDCTFASYLIRLVPDSNQLLPEFLTVYLNTGFGKNQIKRRAMRSINQANVSGSEIRKVQIPILDINLQSSIADMVNQAYTLKKRGENLYYKAQQLLESELDLEKIAFQTPRSYSAKFSEVINNNRADADYYQIPFRQIQQHLDKCETTKLHKIAKITKGIEVGSKAYHENGSLFIRVSNIKDMQIQTGTSDKYITNSLYQSLSEYKPQVGELLLTKDGSPGVCYAVDKEIEGIISGGIVRLTLNNNEIPAEYLALTINSKVCRMQIEQDCSGALILHWRPISIRNLRVPLLQNKVMEKIANLVIESKSAKRKADILLVEAISRVERLIEEAVQP